MSSMDVYIHSFILVVLLFFVSGSLLLMFCSKKKTEKDAGASKKLRPKHGSIQKGSHRQSKGSSASKNVDLHKKQSERNKKPKPEEKHQQPSKSTVLVKSQEQKPPHVISDVVGGVGASQPQKVDKTSEESTSLIKKDAPKKVKKMKINSIMGPSISLHGSLATSGDGTIPKTDDMLAENITDPAFEKSTKKISAKGKQGDDSKPSQANKVKRAEVPVQVKGKKEIKPKKNVQKKKKKVVVPQPPPPQPAGMLAADSLMVEGAEERPKIEKKKVEPKEKKKKEKKKEVVAQEMKAKDSMAEIPEEKISAKDEGGNSTVLFPAEADDEDVEEVKEESKGKSNKEREVGKSEKANKSSKESDKEDENSAASQ
ncbi:hypothetical protein ACQ4LE_000552 [Meloidogyne hapla]|uniref:Uncharacterized protein n=1 Tax=Meloidogyne hapla TaxID=6305 RepID=A0A1I8C2J4_MELHA